MTDTDLCARCGNAFPAGQVCDSCRTPERTPPRQLAVFGAVDGLTLIMGLIFGLIVARQPPIAVWHAALGGASGELIGMSVGQHLSDPDSGWPAAAACGIAGGLSVILPAVPYLVLTGAAALIAALSITVGVAGVIAWLRPEHGITAVARTYGILAGAGLLAGLTGLI